MSSITQLVISQKAKAKQRYLVNLKIDLLETARKLKVCEDSAEYDILISKYQDIKTKITTLEASDNNDSID